MDRTSNTWLRMVATSALALFCSTIVLASATLPAITTAPLA